MRVIALLMLASVVLAACGADGAPQRPEPAEEPARSGGVTVSGTVGIGVSKTR